MFTIFVSAPVTFVNRSSTWEVLTAGVYQRPIRVKRAVSADDEPIPVPITDVLEPKAHSLKPRSGLPAAISSTKRSSGRRGFLRHAQAAQGALKSESARGENRFHSKNRTERALPPPQGMLTVAHRHARLWRSSLRLVTIRTWVSVAMFPIICSGRAMMAFSQSFLMIR